MSSIRLAGIFLTAGPEEKRVIINAPPRIGKTDISVYYIAWRFLNDPTSSVLYCSFDEKLVSRNNRRIKDLLIWLAKRFDMPELLPNPPDEWKAGMGEQGQWDYSSREAPMPQ